MPGQRDGRKDRRTEGRKDRRADKPYFIGSFQLLSWVFQNVTEKLEKVTYFVSTILGVLLPPKVLYATHR